MAEASAHPRPSGTASHKGTANVDQPNLYVPFGLSLSHCLTDLVRIKIETDLSILHGNGRMVVTHKENKMRKGAGLKRL